MPSGVVKNKWRIMKMIQRDHDYCYEGIIMTNYENYGT